MLSRKRTRQMTEETPKRCKVAKTPSTGPLWFTPQQANAVVTPQTQPFMYTPQQANVMATPQTQPFMYTPQQANRMVTPQTQPFTPQDKEHGTGDETPLDKVRQKLEFTN